MRRLLLSTLALASVIAAAPASAAVHPVTLGSPLRFVPTEPRLFPQ